jgi:hypothetical protein
VNTGRARDRGYLSGSWTENHGGRGW